MNYLTFSFSYFDNENNEVIINFSKAFKLLENGEIIIMDHLGKFLSFFIACIAISFEKTPDDNYDQLKKYQEIIEKLIDRIEDVTMEQLDVFASLNIKTSSTISQFLNCLESLMFYCVGNINTSASVSRIKKLFVKHQKITSEALKLQENGKKGVKKGKGQAPVVKVDLNLECVWTLKECGNFMSIFFKENPNEAVNEIKQNASFLHFILKATSKNIAQLATSPDYLKLKHSKATFAALKNYASVLFRQMDIETFNDIYESFDKDSAVAVTDAFMNAVSTVDVIFNTTEKWQDFLKTVTATQNTIDQMIMQVIKRLQLIIDWAFDSEMNDVHADPQGEKICSNALMTIELLHKNFQTMPNAYNRNAYNWIYAFCKKTEITQKNLGVVNRVFFQMMIQQDTCNNVMEYIAYKVSNVYGRLDVSILNGPTEEDLSQNDFQSISVSTIDQAFFQFSNIVRKQIDDLEFCVLRMNSFNSYVKIPGQDNRSSVTVLQNLEISSVVKLTHLGKVVGILCNTRFSLRGNQIETIGKVGIAYFTCLVNVMKHFCQHYDIQNISFQRISLEKLMKEAKTTAKLIYALQPYCEEVIEKEQQKAKRDNKKKIPANKELKYMSRLVLTIEKFATIVHKFDLVAKKNFKKYLHSGEVRDFRILEEQPTRDKSIFSSDDESELATEDIESDEEEEVVTKKARRNRVYSSSEDDQNCSDSDETNVSHESLQTVAPGGFEKNLNKIVQRTQQATRKRKKN